MEIISEKKEKKSKLQYSPKYFTLKTIKVTKRKAFHKEANFNEIYVKNKTHMKIYIKRIHKLFDAKHTYIK